MIKTNPKFVVNRQSEKVYITLEEINQAIADQKPISYFYEKYNISWYQMSRWLEQNNIEYPKPTISRMQNPYYKFKDNPNILQKLTFNDLNEINALLQQKRDGLKITYEAIGKKFNVSRQYIWLIDHKK
jgi:hypothetical protein